MSTPFNPATGLATYRFDWENTLNVGEKHLLAMLRNEHPNTLTVQLADLLDKIAATQGGQLALGDIFAKEKV